VFYVDPLDVKLCAVTREQTTAPNETRPHERVELPPDADATERPLPHAINMLRKRKRTEGDDARSGGGGEAAYRDWYQRESERMEECLDNDLAAEARTRAHRAEPPMILPPRSGWRSTSRQLIQQTDAAAAERKKARSEMRVLDSINEARLPVCQPKPSYRDDEPIQYVYADGSELELAFWSENAIEEGPPNRDDVEEDLAYERRGRSVRVWNKAAAAALGVSGDSE
jgi:hypothetical protein